VDYKIPENEVENVVSVFWQMLMQIESRTKPGRNTLDVHLVEGGYAIMQRCGVTTAVPRWAQNQELYLHKQVMITAGEELRGKKGVVLKYDKLRQYAVQVEDGALVNLRPEHFIVSEEENSE